MTTIKPTILELEELETRFLLRKQCREIYDDFLKRVSKQKGKGKMKRGDFVHFVQMFSQKPFETEEEEYRIIGKFGRNEWSSQEVMKAFNKEDQETFIEIAEMFGAFDY